MFSKLLRALVLILLAQIAVPSVAQLEGKGDTAQPPPIYPWTVHNRCQEPVRLALHFQKDDGRVVTRGWWQLPPQGEVGGPMNSEWIGYLAISHSRKFWWWNPDGPKFGVDLSRDFEFPGDGKRQSATIFGFHWISVLREPITTLTCP